MTGAAITGTLVASNKTQLKGYKQVFMLIYFFAFILALSELLLKSRNSELLAASKSLNMELQYVV